MSKKYYWLLATFAVIYLASFFVDIPNPEELARYNISLTAAMLINITTALPLVAIWYAGFYGFINLHRYASKIKKTPEGDAFQFLSYGLTVLGIGMPVASIISRWLGVATDAEIIGVNVSTVINTHMNVLYPLISFALLYIGARKLTQTLRKFTIPLWRRLIAITGYTFFAILYVVLTFMTPHREYAAQGVKATYSVPDWITLTTIVLPFVIALAFGTYATVLIIGYYRHIRGKLYKKTLKKLNIGIMLVIVAIGLIQFIVTLNSVLVNWALGALLALIYILLLIIAAGFVMIARGSKGLERLEEVR